MAAKVIQRLFQFRRILNLPSSPFNNTPVASSDPASEPAVGSVRAKQGISSPVASLGSNRFFCSSVP
jgi:hypothetical protein